MNAPALLGAHNRVTVQVSKLTGIAAYAILLRGTARILYNGPSQPRATAIDMATSNMCRRNEYPTPLSYGTYPMLIGSYRAIGPRTWDSDRRTSSVQASPGSGGGQSHDDRLEPESEFTVFPVSLHAGRLLRGETIAVANDPKTDLVKEVDWKTCLLPKGEAVWVRRNEYVAV
jgi:hypothetical protein